MNSHLSHLPVLALPVLAGTLLSSCTTTGDPTQGGIFWSEEKAQVRQYQMERELQSTRDANSAERKRQSSLERQYDNLR